MIQQVYGIDLRTDFVPAANFGTISSFVNLFIPLMMVAASVLTLIMFLWGGFTYLTAGGDSEMIAKAQKIFSFTIVGLVLIISSYLFVKLIGKILGINVL